MKMPEHSLRSTAIAAILSIPLATGAAFAQSQDATGTGATETGSSDATSGQQSTPQQQTGSDTGAAGQQQEDSVLATVGGTEIRGSEVAEFVGMLPPRLRTQPPQMLVPLALEQLILRELIIQEARNQNLQEDPEVVALVDGATEVAEEDALVQVWLQRETSDAVTDEAVQQAYDEASAQSQQALPPIEQVRPQIEQHLRQQAVQDIRTRLSEGADVVLYDATGRPMPQSGQGTQGGSTQGGSTQGGGTQGGGSQGGNATDGKADDQSGNMSGNATGGQSDGNSDTGSDTGSNTGTNTGTETGNQSGDSGTTSGN